MPLVNLVKTITLCPGSGNQRIDNFVPEGKLDTNFLDNSNNPSPKPSPKPQRARINDVQISDRYILFNPLTSEPLFSRSFGNQKFRDN